ncbi:hypothetical protein P5673_020251, partial [Acropora cervicornis]
IGGKNIYLRLSVSGECDKKDSVWETLEKELPRVFANTTQNYSGAELRTVRCGSLIFDVVVKFSSEVAEDDIISLIQKAVLVGNLGVLSVHVSYVTLNPHGAQTTVTSPTNTDPKSGKVKNKVVLMKLHMQVLQCSLIPRDQCKKPIRAECRLTKLKSLQTKERLPSNGHAVNRMRRSST